MSLTHDFVAVSPSQLEPLISLNKALFADNKIRYRNGDKIYWPLEYEDADDILLPIIEKHRKDCVSVHDDVILPIISNFEAVDTLFGGFIPYKGLNYYGFTLFPTESISTLILVLQKANKVELNSLIQLCNTAIVNGLYILHRGI